jgi:hypothetical protein
MKRLRTSTRLDRWQQALIAKSERLRTQGVFRTAPANEDDAPAPADAATPPRRGVLRWARRVPSAPPGDDDAPTPRRSRRKEADAFQASGLDYQHALQVQWWEYRHKFLEAMRLDLEIRSDTT